MATDNHTAIPPSWEIEWCIVELACEQLGLTRETVTPESRLIEDLRCDSMDAVELTIAIEEHFNVTLSDADCQAWFANRSVTLRLIAELVGRRWGTGQADRSRWQTPRDELPVPTKVPATQFGGVCSPKQWMEGQLFESIGANREGYQQFQRRTDGMRCVLIPARMSSWEIQTRQHQRIRSPPTKSI